MTAIDPQHLHAALDHAYARLADTARSRQTALGVTDYVSCPRKAAYKHFGVEPSDPEPVNRAAVIGTLMHNALLPLMAEHLRSLGYVVDVEVETHVAGVLGHADLLVTGQWVCDEPRLSPRAEFLDPWPGPIPVDLKTEDGRKNSNNVTWPDQLAGYGATTEGHIVATSRNDGAGRVVTYDEYDLNVSAATDDDGEWHYLNRVSIMSRRLDKAAGPEDLPRDPERGYCKSCPFRTRCLGADLDAEVAAMDDPTMAEHVEAYRAAAAEEKAAKTRKDMARDILASRFGAIGRFEAGGQQVSFSKGRPGGFESVPDGDAMAKDWAFLGGGDVPMKTVETRAVASRISLTPVKAVAA